MKDQNKTKQQLIEELGKLRKQNAGMERLSNEQKLEEEKYRSLVESTDDSVYVVDKDLRYTFMNKQNLSRLGLPSNKVIGKAYEEFHTKEGTAKFKKRINNVFRTCRSKTHEYRSERDGKYFLRTYSPIIGAGGKPKAVTVFSKDISDLKKTEEELQKSEERFRRILEKAPFGYYRVGKDGLWQYVNPEWERMHGYSYQEIIGKHFEVTQPEEAKEQAREYVRRVLSGETMTGEFGRHRKDGAIEYHSFNIQPVYQQEEIVAIEGFINDITEHIRSEKALKKSKQELALRNKIIQLFLTFPDDSVYSELLNLILKTLESKFGTFGYFNEEGSFIVPALTREIYWDKCQVSDKEVIFKLGTFSGIWARAIKERKILYSNEGPFSYPEGHVPIENTIVAPIIYENRIISAIHMANKKTGYDHKDRELLKIIANHVAPILSARIESNRREAKRIRTEEALKKEKDKAQKYLDIANSIMLALDADGKVTLLNKKGCEILGYSKEEVIGKDWFQTFLPERMRKEVKEIFDRIMNGEIKELEDVDGFSVINKSGKEIPLFWCNSIITDENNNIIGTLSSGEDITKRKQAEEDLKKYHADLKRLSTQLIAAHESERKRISQELHDEIGQALTAVKINLATIVSQFQSDIAPAIMERLAEAADLTDNLLDQIQNISLDLRPSMLDDLGLVPTLRWYIKRFEKRTNIKTQFKTVNVKERLHHEIETSIYRIVQEALTNVVKYAEADLVNINLKGKKSEIELLIEDNGRGFDLEKVISSPPASHGIGLLGIQERIAMLKGTTQLLTQPKIGTKIIINIPKRFPQ